MITCSYKKPGSWLLAILSTKRCFYAFLAHKFIKRRPIFLELFVVGYWRGCLSEARCRLAYGPADATATHCLLLQ